MQSEPREPELVVVASNNNYNDINKDKNDNDRYCRKCNKRFTRPRDLRRHIRCSKAHKNDPRYECPVCSKVFSRPDTQKKHQANKSCLDRFFKILEKAGMIIPINDNNSNFILY